MAPLVARLGRARWPTCSARCGRPATRSRPRGSALLALRSAAGLARRASRASAARALVAGNAAHSMLPLDGRRTAAFALVLLLLGHAVGWPVARGGSQAIADAMASLLRSLGGEIETEHRGRARWPSSTARGPCCSTSRRAQLLAIAGDALPGRYRRALARFRYGPGVFKLDYALDGPVPWAAEECRRAGTVHLGGTLERDRGGRGARSRAAAIRGGRTCWSPSRACSTRAARPAGKHTLWAYCHVPNGSTRGHDRRRSRRQIERFAPGFRDVVLARAARWAPAEMEARQPATTSAATSTAALRTCASCSPGRSCARCRTRRPNPRLFLCSSSTPPGGGVHGMCGWHAARAALRGVLR